MNSEYLNLASPVLPDFMVDVFTPLTLTMTGTTARPRMILPRAGGTTAPSARFYRQELPTSTTPCSYINSFWFLLYLSYANVLHLFSLVLFLVGSRWYLLWASGHRKNPACSGGSKRFQEQGAQGRSSDVCLGVRFGAQAQSIQGASGSFTCHSSILEQDAVVYLA